MTEYANRIAVLEIVVAALARALTEEQRIEAIGEIVMYANSQHVDTAVKLIKG